jgi:hypothetical protein
VPYADGNIVSLLLIVLRDGLIILLSRVQGYVLLTFGTAHPSVTLSERLASGEEETPAVILLNRSIYLKNK